MRLLRVSLMAWLVRRLFWLARTPAGRKLLLFLWAAAVKWRKSKRTVAARP
jgi:hypothetical protein